MLITNEIKTKLLKDLEMIYPILIKYKSKPIDHDKAISTSIRLPGTKSQTVIHFYQYYGEMEYLRNFLDSLLSVPRIKENFSREYLGSRLDDILHKIINLNKKEISNNLEQELKLLEKILSKNIEQEWMVIYPLENIRITDDEDRSVDDSFLFGNTRIYRFNEAIKKSIEEKCGVRFMFTEHDNLIGKICSNIKIIAGDSIKAKEKAYFVLDDILSILRCFIPWLEIDVEGGISGKTGFIRTINPKTKSMDTSTFTKRGFITNNYALHKSHYEALSRNGVDVINNLYSSEQKNDFKIQIL